MSLLTYNELKALVDIGAIENVPPENINAASIDLNLAEGYLLEAYPGDDAPIILGEKETPRMRKASGWLNLAPGEFALAATQQIFHLPNDIAAIYVLKSSMARAGLNHLNAGYCDPGWNGSALTMEFHNTLKYHSLVLRPGDRCGQVVLFRGEVVPDLQSYAVRGQYCGDRGVQASKGVR